MFIKRESGLEAKVADCEDLFISTMAFKFPLLTKKEDVPFSIKGLPSFCWGEIVHIEEIGRGSFGSVSVAKHVGETVVVKKLLGSNDAEKRLFWKEARILADLKNTNIVEFKAICQKPSAIMLEYVSFDFSPFGCAGDKVSSLDNFLDYIDSRNAIEEFLFQMNIAKDIVSGIAYLHSKDIAHRDLKPSNILVSNSHYMQLDKEELQKRFMLEPIRCKITDFGESRARATQTASICQTATNNVQRGSPAYMAPEIFSGEQFPAKLDDLKAIDIWALGMVFFMLLNPDARFPFEIEVKNKGSVAWRKVIENLYEKKVKPRNGNKYDSYRLTEWFKIFEAYERCTDFTPMSRPKAQTIQEYFQSESRESNLNFQLKVSQASAVTMFDAKLAAIHNSFTSSTEIPGDGTNACSFLCLSIADILLSAEDDKPLLAANDWKRVAGLAERIIHSAPVKFNCLRNVGKFYDAIEAYSLLRDAGLIGEYDVSEEFYKDQTKHQVFSRFGKNALRMTLQDLYRTASVGIAFHICGGYTILVGCSSHWGQTAPKLVFDNWCSMLLLHEVFTCASRNLE